MDCRGKALDREVRAPIEVIYSTMRRFPPAELRRIAKEIRCRGIEVVHTHMSRAHFFGVLLRWFSRRSQRGHRPFAAFSVALDVQRLRDCRFRGDAASTMFGDNWCGRNES